MNLVEKNADGMTRSQARVLAALHAAGHALTLSDLAQATGLHANTVRGHLHALIDQERVTRIAVRRGGRGRPAWSYLARESEYAALALALAQGLDEAPEPITGDSASPAVRGGRAWGARLRTQLTLDNDPAPFELLLQALAHSGFAPKRTGERELQLHACPLIEAARSHPDIVCAAHLGLLEGLLGGPGATMTPRPETLGCLVSLP